MDIGKYIKKLREDKEFSINQLALYSGVSAAHISRIERGLREPSPDILKKIAKVLDADYIELFEVAGYIQQRMGRVNRITDNNDENYPKLNFGERLKQLREEKGLTQAEVAKLLSIGESTISFYESGKRQPDYETLIRLAELFNVSIDFLLGKTDIRNPADEFLVQAKEQYGSRGKKQAEELLENMQALFEGGELPDEDKDEFFRAITEIYFDAKEKNKKYTPKKYRKNNNEE